MTKLAKATANLCLHVCMFLACMAVMAAPVGYLCGAVAHFFLAGWQAWL